jgi:hydrogenase maturation protease
MNTAPRILIACVGNLFLGDDAFGVHVARRLACAAPLPPHVRAVDFGIRGLDLAYALSDGSCDVAVLVDACPRGQAPPGTLYLIEPDLAAIDGLDLPDAHSMDPVKVLRLARSLAAAQTDLPRRVLVLGCEPADPFDPHAEPPTQLSPPVALAVERAAEMLRSLVSQLSTDPFTMEISHDDIQTPVEAR